MQFKGIEKNDEFTTLYYELTWGVGWEQMISFFDVAIATDFSKGSIQSIGVGMIARAEAIDVTNDLKQNGNKIKNTSFAKVESGYIVMAGYSSIMEVSMRITMWNQTNRFMVQLMNDIAIGKFGEHCYDKYVDSIEILGHVDYAKNKR